MQNRCNEKIDTKLTDLEVVIDEDGDLQDGGVEDEELDEVAEVHVEERDEVLTRGQSGAAVATQREEHVQLLRLRVAVDVGGFMCGGFEFFIRW